MSHQTRSKTRSPASSSSTGVNMEVRQRSQAVARLPIKKDGPEDKENVKKNAFQPPSPLTSKRSKSQQKSSGAKKILSPNSSNQWARDRESTSASAREQPRSSPIHTGQSYHQDRDPGRATGHASRSSSNMLRESSAYTIGDLDLMAKDDDFGPPIIDSFNLGSFDAGSPRGSPGREPKSYRRPAERGSPSFDRSLYRYRSSAPLPPVYPSHPPPTGYYGAPPHSAPTTGYGAPPTSRPPPPGYGFPPGYHTTSYPADQPPWTSPRAYDYDRGQHTLKSPAPYSGRAGPASPVTKRRWEGTPEEGTSKGRSPFRSPMSPGSAKKFKRSPIWGAGTPSIGMYGSFGMMDTPGAHLDGFSPMGPSFASFEDDSPPLPMAGEALDARLSLVAGDGRTRAPPPNLQRRTVPPPHDSPGFNFMNEMAHMPGTMPAGSPVRPSNREREKPLYYSDKDRVVRDRAPPPMPLQPQSPVKRPTQQPSTTKRHIFTSPLEPSNHGSASRRASWFDHPRQAPGPVRLELGEMGAKNLETRRSLEGINSMVRGTAATPRSAPPHPVVSYDQSRSAPYRTDINTPVKVGVPGPPPAGRMPTSQSRGHVPPYHGSSSMSGRTPVQMPTSASRYPIQPPSSLHPPSSGHRPSKIISTPVEKMSTPANERRNPCNCKKSKCLKLYCECFAAELFCDGCNCNDCRNNTQYEDIRNKAMKDTRAKNPNAFKPRIIARGGTRPTGATPPSAHNMGCKCKRSECLKKYCECFQAGVMCGNKCKCVDCLNYVGSQALIDKRRKIKDHRGAEFAMQTADDAWKGKHAPPQPRPAPAAASSAGRRPAPSLVPSRSSHGPHGQSMQSLPPHMMRSSPPSHHTSYSPRSVPPPGPPHYMGHPMGHASAGYPPLGMPMRPGSASHQHGQQGVSKGPHSGRLSETKSPIRPSSRADSSLSQFKPRESMPAGSRVVVKMEEGASKSIVTPATAKKIDSSSTHALSKPGEATSTPVLKPSDPIKTSAAPAPGQPLTTPVATSKPSESRTVVKTESSKALPQVTPTVATLRTVVKTDSSKASPQVTPTVATPRTPGVRLGYDPYSSKKKRQLIPGQNEATFPYFGELPEQPKTTALAVFSFLSNDEIYNAGLVCKRWSRLATDEEMWQF